MRINKMSEKKNSPVELNSDILLADALLRVTALEKLLIQKGIITKVELSEVTNSLVEKVTKLVLDKLQTSKGLDDFINSLGGENKKTDKN
jgi:hypothetical protein